MANGALLTMIMSSRVVFGMAEQGLLPRPLALVLPERRTPWVAIVVTTLLAIGLTLTGDQGDLADTVVLLLLFVFLSTDIAVLVLRKDEVAADHFRVWAGDPGAGRRVLRAAAVAAGGRHPALRRRSPGHRRDPVPAGPGPVVAVDGGAGPRGAGLDRLLRRATATGRMPG